MFPYANGDWLVYPQYPNPFQLVTLHSGFLISRCAQEVCLSPARLLCLPRLRSMQTEAGIYWPAQHCFFSTLQAFYFSLKAALAFTGLGSVVGRGGPLPSTILAAGIGVSATRIGEPHGSAASSGLPSVSFSGHLGVSRVAKSCFLCPKAVYSWPSCGAGRLMLAPVLLSGGAAHACTCDVRMCGHRMYYTALYSGTGQRGFGEK